MNIDYSLYGTPLESTTYKFAKALQKKFGIIQGVTDKNYITNSYHVHVTEEMNAFDKLKFEAQFQELSPGGAISYVEVPNMQNNIDAVLSVMQFIYDNIMYAELNTKSDYCENCGYDGEIQIIEDENGKLMEPMERVIVNCPEVYSGTVINKLNLRKAMMEAMEIEGDYVKITFIAPTRGLLGYRSEFINDTRGEGSLVRSFERYEEHKGEMPGRTNGVLISQVAGSTMAYALNALSERAQMFVDPAVDVYEGMIIGMNSRKEDMTVNPCKNKKLTNVRASGTDDAVKLQAARTFTLEEALEFIDDDELVEITPDSIRLRKKFLNEHDRLRYNKSRQASK